MIGLTTGDAAGIGPEIAGRLCRALLRDRADVSVAVLADRRIMLPSLGVNIPAGTPAALECLRDRPGIYLLDRKNLDPREAVPGTACATCGKRSVEDLLYGVELCRAGFLDGLVYGPLNKHAFQMGGYAYSGTIPLLAAYCGVSESQAGEVNVVDGVWTVRVTSHIPLGQVAQRLTAEGIERKIRFLYRQMIQNGELQPRLAVAGLNPHNGDGGAFGREEIELIAPAVRQACGQGVPVSGPYAADTLFQRAFQGEFNGIVTMYHDQGQIAMKTRGFDRIITIPGGLPILAATPAHGTAYDIAGRGLASESALYCAFRYVWKSACRRLAGT